MNGACNEISLNEAGLMDALASEAREALTMEVETL